MILAFAPSAFARNDDLAWHTVDAVGEMCTSGDANCDATFDGADIDAFFVALGDPPA